MTIYQVIYNNPYGERVADFGLYVDKLDAEKRAFEVRMKVPLESGQVSVEHLFVHDCSQDASSSPKKGDLSPGKKKNRYNF